MSTESPPAKEPDFVRRFLEEHRSRISELKYSLFLFRKNALAVLGLVLILAVITIALLAPFLAVQQPTYVDINGQLQQRWAFHDICARPEQNTRPTAPVIVGAASLTVYVGENLGFTAVASDPDQPADSMTWLWTWGDGTTSAIGSGTTTTNSYAHAWDLAGNYSVGVSVSDGYNAAVVSATLVNVTAEPVPSGLGTLQGMITSNGSPGGPIGGAQVIASPGGFAGLTAPNGTYAISLPAGTYAVTASAWLFGERTASGITVGVNGTTTSDLALTPDLGWIVGNITSSTGIRITTAQVTATGANGLQMAVGVDSTGAYNMTLPAGTYALNATDAANLYSRVPALNVSVLPGRATDRSFSLTPLTLDCETFLGPSLAHPFGTDNFGEDWYSKVLYGAGLSLEIGLLVVIPASLIGSLLGLLAGFRGGIIEEVIMRVTDVFLSIPSLILAIAITAVLGRSIVNVTYALIITWWPWYTRLVRGQVLSLKERQFVESAKSVGASPTRLMLRHILPNSISPVIVQASMDFGYVILTAAGLGFLGLGAPPGTAEWGVMISEGLTYLFNAPWMSVFPGLAIVLTVLGFNLLGDGLRDILDPRLRR